MINEGHLFVAQADMTRLAADAFLIPCDSQLNVSGSWRPLVDRTPPTHKGVWFKPQGTHLVDGIAILHDSTPPGATPDEVTGLRVLVDTVGVDSIGAMVDRALIAVQSAADRATVHGNRSLPLVAMPILGVGQGRFPGRRAEVVRELIRRLLDFVAAKPIDVVLSLVRSTDFAAAQWERHNAEVEGIGCWPSLADHHQQLADRLGDKAARGQLSVFAGAGVSRPVGFPSWKQLLQDLSDKPLNFTESTDYPQLAQELRVDGLNVKVAKRLTTEKHALGHALIVNLRTKSVVTTNYDPCLENAAATVHPDDQPLQVIARQIVVGGNPWLLKLHGDVAHPDTIVLTTDQYQRLKNDYGALRGVVQTLMLTSHLLFIGFGFADTDFLAMAEAVKRVRELATDLPADASVGTAIELRLSGEHKHRELDYFHMRTDDDLQAAARQLEILLDRMAWRCQVTGRGRASYLLDSDYAEDATEHDRILADALKDLGMREEEWTQSSGAQAVRNLLGDLGA